MECNSIEAAYHAHDMLANHLQQFPSIEQVLNEGQYGDPIDMQTAVMDLQRYWLETAHALNQARFKQGAEFAESPWKRVNLDPRGWANAASLINAERVAHAIGGLKMRTDTAMERARAVVEKLKGVTVWLERHVVSSDAIRIRGDWDTQLDDVSALLASAGGKPAIKGPAKATPAISEPDVGKALESLYVVSEDMQTNAAKFQSELDYLSFKYGGSLEQVADLLVAKVGEWTLQLPSWQERLDAAIREKSDAMWRQWWPVAVERLADSTHRLESIVWEYANVCELLSAKKGQPDLTTAIQKLSKLDLGSTREQVKSACTTVLTKVRELMIWLGDASMPELGVVEDALVKVQTLEADLGSKIQAYRNRVDALMIKAVREVQLPAEMVHTGMDIGDDPIVTPELREQVETLLTAASESRIDDLKAQSTGKAHEVLGWWEPRLCMLAHTDWTDQSILRRAAQIVVLCNLSMSMAWLYRVNRGKLIKKGYSKLDLPNGKLNSLDICKALGLRILGLLRGPAIPDYGSGAVRGTVQVVWTYISSYLASWFNEQPQVVKALKGDDDKGARAFLKEVRDVLAMRTFAPSVPESMRCYMWETSWEVLRDLDSNSPKTHDDMIAKLTKEGKVVGDLRDTSKQFEDELQNDPEAVVDVEASAGVDASVGIVFKSLGEIARAVVLVQQVHDSGVAGLVMSSEWMRSHPSGPIGEFMLGRPVPLLETLWESERLGSLKLLELPVVRMAAVGARKCEARAELLEWIKAQETVLNQKSGNLADWTDGGRNLGRVMALVGLVAQQRVRGEFLPDARLEAHATPLCALMDAALDPLMVETLKQSELLEWIKAQETVLNQKPGNLADWTDGGRNLGRVMALVGLVAQQRVRGELRNDPWLHDPATPLCALMDAALGPLTDACANGDAREWKAEPNSVPRDVGIPGGHVCTIGGVSAKPELNGRQATIRECKQFTSGACSRYVVVVNGEVISLPAHSLRDCRRA